MKSLTKVAAVMLAASILFSMAACNKGGSKSRSGQKITSDMPWFEANPFEVDNKLDPDKETEYIYSQLIGSDEKNIAVLTTGSYKLPENVDWQTFDGTGYQISKILMLDKATRKTVSTLDLTTLLEDGFVESASYIDGKISLNVGYYDLETNVSTRKIVEVDPLTGEILGSNDGTRSDPVQNTYTIGKYIVESCAFWTETDSNYYLNIISPDGDQKKVEFKDEGSRMAYIYSVIPMSDKTALAIGDSNGGTLFFELDLASGKVSKIDNKEFDWLDIMSIYRLKGCSDGNVYSMDSTGITKIDLKKKKEEQILNFSWSSMDRNLVNNFMLADVTGDSIILYGETMKQQPYCNNYYDSSSEFLMYELKKADKNPHAGKTILELYSPYGYVSEEINAALTKYNETNPNYFIEVTDRYTTNVSYQYEDAKNDDESSDIGLKYMSDMSNKLAMDIMNGEGPDMLINIDGYGALKNSNYLLDLNSYADSMKSDKYFTNVLDAMKVDGKLYNMPICFGIYGIQTDPKYAPTTCKGFTTDEYVKFLKETLNGKDLLTSGQAHYFSTLFDSMSEKFISNRKADFSGPEFAALAEFVKDNVQEKSPDYTQDDRVIMYDGSTPAEIQKAICASVSGYWDYIQNVENTNGCSAILGLPSSDGRGPSVFAYDSIAISAQAHNVEACTDFLKTLISDETQKELANKGYLVLNREAFRTAGEEAVKYFNTVNPAYPYGYYGEGPAPKNNVKYTSEHIDALEKAIESCSCSSSDDAAISIILVEEMPSYFSGQKELKDVIKIAQDRVQKVLDERK